MLLDYVIRKKCFHKPSHLASYSRTINICPNILHDHSKNNVIELPVWLQMLACVPDLKKWLVPVVNHLSQQKCLASIARRLSPGFHAFPPIFANVTLAANIGYSGVFILLAEQTGTLWLGWCFLAQCAWTAHTLTHPYRRCFWSWTMYIYGIVWWGSLSQLRLTLHDLP